MITAITLPSHLKLPNFLVVKDTFTNLVQRRMYLASRLVDNPSDTYYFEVDDDQMRFFGIVKGSIVVVDTSVEVSSGQLIVCCVDDEWLVRKFCTRGNSTYLCINNSFDACINVTGKDIKIMGVVTWNCQPYTL